LFAKTAPKPLPIGETDMAMTHDEELEAAQAEIKRLRKVVQENEKEKNELEDVFLDIFRIQNKIDKIKGEISSMEIRRDCFSITEKLLNEALHAVIHDKENKFMRIAIEYYEVQVSRLEEEHANNKADLERLMKIGTGESEYAA